MARRIIIHNHFVGDAEQYDPSQPRNSEGKWTSTGGGVSGYHGASSAILASVKKHGLVPKNKDLHVHITNSRNFASVYAESNVKGKNKPIVFEVKIPDSEFANYAKSGSAAGSTKPIPPSWIVGYRELNGSGGASELKQL